MIRFIVTVVLATLLVAACVGPGATSVPSSSPSPSATQSSSATATASATPLTGWRLVTIPPPVAERWPTPTAVAAGGGRLVAVGGPVHPEGTIEGPMYGTIWTSADGLAWTAVGLDPILEVGAGRPTSGPEPGFSEVAYGPGGFVVLGHEMTDQGIRVGIWRSETGEAWERVHVPQAVFDGGRPAAVTAGGPGYVIVGGWLDPDAPRDGVAPPRAAVWTSPDGDAWIRVRDQDGFAVGGYIDTGETPDAGGMLDVTPTEAGLVAVGRTCKGVNLMEDPMGLVSSCRPLIWTSENGTKWTRVDPDLPAHPGNVSFIAAAGARIAAVGGGWSDDPAVRYTLRSGDGTTWRWDEDSASSPFEGIVAIRGTLMATSHETGQVGLWASTTGATWTAVADVPSMSKGPSVRESDVVALDDRVVIVGWREGEEDSAQAGFAIVGPFGR